ncbi:OLC1v1000559C1 [Oldenlandia corymbosa var. corymbosa]|uniref:OLC1v1000559C1 n=1 Tax=Oldenlandia corymbosa var. corymbosa TaxID=529605 RepID=A0AAV1D6P5_OLDCO|nr:OLC1v1000559C1 [Oldenlandia corymbosa var. corymbosa]
MILVLKWLSLSRSGSSDRFKLGNFMAHQSHHRLRNAGVAARLILILLGCLFLVAYVVGPALFGGSGPQIKSAVVVSCPKCSCHCLSEEMELPPDIFNGSYSDCHTGDPEMNEEMTKDITTMLSEEISLQKNVTRDSLEHTQELILESRRSTLHYQNEGAKCLIMVGTCEDAREVAEAALAEERKLTLLWEERARNFGWTDS